MIGAQWLTAPPPDWRMVPLRSLFQRRKLLGFVDEPMVSVFRDHGVVFKDSRDNLNKTAEDRSIYQLIDDGWLVINRMKAWQGSVGVSAIRGIVSGHYICFEPAHREDSRYLNHLLRSPVYAAMFGALSRGVRNGQIEIDNEALGSLGVLLPPVEEQRRIADFLDDQTTRIDQIIAAREQQLSLVDEFKSAWVTESYSRLAEQHGLVGLRYGLASIRQGWSPQCLDGLPAAGEWGVLRAGCVNGGVFRQDDLKTLPVDITPRMENLVLDGDLVMNRASGSLDLIGSCAVANSVRPLTLLSDKLYRLESNGRWDRSFIAGMWLSRQIRDHLRLGVSGAEGMANSLPAPRIRDARLPNCPPPNQTHWVSEFRRLEASLGGWADSLLSSLTLLQELKRSLISAAVSGEFDVATAGGRGVPV
jgi:type I restriction enzyme S subunit